MGFRVLNVDVLQTQTAAIALFEKTGFHIWGRHPFYARVGDELVSGLFLTKCLDDSLPLQSTKTRNEQEASHTP
jgi:phosphoribosylformimino-5-aminoimidazole carboxamide ribotide isomerase